MNPLPKKVQNLIAEFERLPGVGEKTAARFVFDLLRTQGDKIESLALSLSEVKQGIVPCAICGMIADNNLCTICQQERDGSVIAVVESPLDVVAIEKTNFPGVYHVLGGVLSPIDGIGPEQLRIDLLLDRAQKKPKEIILALSPTIEGETTSLYIYRELNKMNPDLLITRIALGLPIGADLEYADEITVSRAFEGRKAYN